MEGEDIEKKKKSPLQNQSEIVKKEIGEKEGEPGRKERPARDGRAKMRGKLDQKLKTMDEENEKSKCA